MVLGWTINKLTLDEVARNSYISVTMASKLLLRLIDEAILPAVLVVFTKLVSLAALIRIFNYSWELKTSAAFPSLQMGTHAQLVVVNSYSNLVTFAVVAAGLVWILAKAYHFHDTHVAPTMTLKLLSWNLTGLLSNSHEIYHQAVIWLSYLWLIFSLMIIHSAVGLQFVWLTVAVFAATIFLSWLFIHDIEREVV